jgi:GntR family transcriptional regulator
MLAGYVAHVSIDPYDPEPLYRQLAAIIRGQIESGQLAKLDRLPSEHTLGQEYGVSRDTVREAMRLLREQGLIFTLGQRGSYVGPRPS